MCDGIIVKINAVHELLHVHCCDDAVTMAVKTIPRLATMPALRVSNGGCEDNDYEGLSHC